MADETVDIAIVGAGVSGVYAAWRLKEHRPDQKIVVFEASQRVGGRLLSVQPPGIDNMVAELGGMRILREVQPRIRKLIDVLNERLAGDEQIGLFDFPVSPLQNLAYLRGVHLRRSDFTQRPEKVPYSLTFLERGMLPEKIIINAIEQIVPGITGKGLTEEQRRAMTQGAEFCDIPLYKQGFWNVLMRIISGEAYLLGVDAGGYNSTLTNWNAADAIPWFLTDFGVDARYQGFRKGFQQVPKSLADLFRAAGGEVRLHTPLLHFTRTGGGFALHFRDKTVDARALILAMPRRSLDLIAPESPSLDAIAEQIRSVTPRPLFKLFTIYQNPWWRAAGYYKPDDPEKTKDPVPVPAGRPAGDKPEDEDFVYIEAGRSVTDLPVRQTYYWPKNDGQPAREGRAMLMASYDDGANIGFWDGLRERRRLAWQQGTEVKPPTQGFVGPDEPPPAGAGQGWSRYQAPERMVAEVARQLAAIHGLAYTPKVLSAAFRDWGDDPYGGGWNSWNIGVQSAEVKAKMVDPFPGSHFHICGEAYSHAQGWVEGALETADLVLKTFGIEPL